MKRGSKIIFVLGVFINSRVCIQRLALEQIITSTSMLPVGCGMRGWLIEVDMLMSKWPVQILLIFESVMACLIRNNFLVIIKYVVWDWKWEDAAILWHGARRYMYISKFFCMVISPLFFVRPENRKLACKTPFSFILQLHKAFLHTNVYMFFDDVVLNCTKEHQHVFGDR